MQILKDIKKNKGLNLALGYFDAIHLGHLEIINKLNSLDGKKAIITFQNNPSNYFLKNKTSDIQTLSQREKNLEKYKIDYLYELDFEKYKNLTADEYINLLIENFEPKNIIVGYNHTFGKNKIGTANYLKKHAPSNVIIINEYRYDNQKVSSSAIRKKIQNGELELVNKLLKRSFSIKNKVVEGDKIARTLGYKTANINWSENIVKLPYGVYFGYVELNNKKYDALISWGIKPTLKKTKQEVLEAHIYNFNNNIYGKEIEVFFDKKLREQKNFGNIEALKKQLDNDYLEFKRHIS